MKTTSPYTRKQIAAARRTMRSFGCGSLLSSPASNPKTAKSGEKVNVYTAPLHLAPYNLSGYQVCPGASRGCAAACLHTAGNQMFMVPKEKARIARTKFFFKAREEFFIVLYAEVAQHIRKAKSESMVPAVRFNATSDIAWEVYKLPSIKKNIFEAFPELKGYDYTKIEKRMNKFSRGELPDNYFLSFSASEDSWEACLKVLNQGGVVSVAFNVKRGQPMITEYRGYPVVDGDRHDYIPSIPKGHINGLRAKGKAIGDTSGFVRQVT